ncbi:hypothetical protein ACHAWO_010647 [Cyclotella atomus]|uniref:Uncharacterized protein n=1 Tax=Cyclotella atomus TaxID=382360 RepID=A0ABD3QVN7_9STRA
MNIKSSCYRGKPGFIAVVALLLSTSALPVKSDAFSIIRCGSSRMATHSTDQIARNAQPKNVVLEYIEKARTFVSKNFFLVGMIVAVSFARLLPELGKNGSILKELANAAVNMKLNSLIQTVTFGAWPFLVGLPMTKGIDFLFPGFLPAPLLDGLLILTCLPTTLNMCILLTSKAEGSVASALCNAVISNLAGIFITPALFMHFFGKSIELPFIDLVKKLCSKVLLPVAVGQALRATPMQDFYTNHTGFFKRFQESVILGIVWNAFCNAFTSGIGLEMKHSAALLTLLPALHAGSLISLSSFFHSPIFDLSSEEAKAATFCGAQKTLAFGLPLINTIFEGNMNLAAYCAPLMIMHPLQIVVGSLLVPYLSDHNPKLKRA